MKQLGVIGDIHAEDETLESVLRFFDHHGVTRIVSVGDIVDGHGDADRCCQLLLEQAIPTVRGNHDRWFLTETMRHLEQATQKLNDESLAFLKSLPTTKLLQSPLGGILVSHGVGEDDMSFLQQETQGFDLQAIPALRSLRLDPKVQILLGGHTHRSMVRTFPNLIVINAGTLHRSQDPVITRIDLDRHEVHVHPIRDGEIAETAEVLLFPDPNGRT